MLSPDPANLTEDEPILGAALAKQRLMRSVLIGIRDRTAVLIGPTVRVDIALDAACTLTAAPAPGPLTIGALAGYLGADDVDLYRALSQAGLLDPPDSGLAARQEAYLPVGVVPLAEALRRVRSCEPVNHLLAVTSTEALWTGHEPHLAMTALMMFAARLPGSVRAQVYRAADGPDPPVVFGDLPAKEGIAELLTRAQRERSPLAYSLPESNTTGRLPDSDHGLRTAAGRLAVGGAVRTEKIATTSGNVILVTAAAAEPIVACEAFADPPPAPTWVMGGGLDPDTATALCLAEAAEYLASSGPLPPDAIHASAQKLDGAWMSPDTVISYQPAHRERLGVSAFNPHEPQWWLRGCRAGQPIWLPAALLTVPPKPWPSWWHHSSLSSNGVAAHPQADAAAVNAWLELVERDAFQRCRALADANPPPVIDPSCLPPTERAIHSALHERARVTILRLDSPTGLSVILVRADGRGAGLAFGSAAAADPAAAVRRALIEALAQTGYEPAVIEPHQVRTPADHAALYSDPAWRQRLDWMLRGAVVDLANFPATGQIHVPPHVATYSYPLAGMPIHVIRVLDPSLIPLTFGYDSDPDGRADLTGLWQRSGRSTSGPLEPHPLG
jgi:ribosomal protein S12 methylthiotransferase accessory factor YcaO